ncbi:MAG TPA: GntR family transcriptional regulator [Thermotogota bacterium]|nr:GntR family transcriptional regulator [Thermotogota bacterium]HRW92494.1 GntR family transcriptional regulator [Thermotogota bacterium]
MIRSVDKHSGVPAYLQIMNTIKKEILLGHYQRKDQLPPVRELAQLFGVNMNTVMRSLEKLANEGLIESEHGVGYFIRDVPDVDLKTIQLLQQTISLLKKQGVKLPMVLLLLEELWKEADVS